MTTRNTARAALVLVAFLVAASGCGGSSGTATMPAPVQPALDLTHPVTFAIGRQAVSLPVVGIYANIDNIKGSGTDSHYPGWRPVTSFSFDAKTGVLGFDGASDQSGPKLFDRVMQITELRDAELAVVVRQADGKPGTLMTIGARQGPTRTKTLLIDFSAALGATDQVPQDAVSLIAGSYKVCTARVVHGILGVTTCAEIYTGR